MARNVLDTRRAEVQQLSTEFQLLLTRFGEISITPEEQERYLKTFRNSLNEVHKTMSVMMINGECPSGFKKCSLCGNCIPNDARDCRIR